jgi:hypothetical protein
MGFSGKPYGINPNTGTLEPLTNISGLSNIYYVNAATTSNLTATYSSGILTNSGANAALQIDDVALSVGDVVLVKNQSTATQNGLYVVTTVGDGSTPWVLTRSADMDTSTEVEERDFFWVLGGTSNADNGFALSTPGETTLDTTPLTFTRMLGSATGSGQPASGALTDLSDVGVVPAADKTLYSTAEGVWAYTTLTSAARSLLDDADASAMRTTLGLGTAATLSVGTGANNIPQLDGSGKLPAVDGSQLTNVSSSGPPPQIDVYTDPGAFSWTKPAGAVWIEVTVKAGGGGGGSGAYYTSNSNRNGGAGGGGGGTSTFRFAASAISSPVSGEVGAGGAGADSISGTSNANGSAGEAGGASWFGTYLYADGGNGGAGGTAAGSAATAGSAGAGLYAGGAGGAGGYAGTSGGTGVGVAAAGGGGGGGGAISSTGVRYSVGAGGASGANVISATGNSGGNAATTGTPTAGDGGSSAAGLYFSGGGGGGGIGIVIAGSASSNGGAGGLYGGGGGGGGAGTRHTVNTVPSGAGGDGGSGVVIVTTWF